MSPVSYPRELPTCTHNQYTCVGEIFAACAHRGRGLSHGEVQRQRRGTEETRSRSIGRTKKDSRASKTAEGCWRIVGRQCAADRHIAYGAECSEDAGRGSESEEQAAAVQVIEARKLTVQAAQERIEQAALDHHG